MPASQSLRGGGRHLARILLRALFASDQPDRPDPGADTVLDRLDRLIGDLPGLERRGFLALLQGLDFSPVALSARPARLRDLPPEKVRERLEKLERSSATPLRLAFIAARALLAMAWFSDEASWPAIGYHGPWLGRVDVEPAQVDRAVVHHQPPEPGQGGIYAGRLADRDLSLTAQVCVVGSGAGGAAAARALAEAGIDVVVLEEGAHHTSADFDQREDTAIARLYRDGGRRTTWDGSLAIIQGCAVGGSTVHNTGMALRAPERVIERWRREHGFEGDSVEIDAAYRRAEEWLNAHPVPDDDVNLNNSLFAKGAAAAGLSSRRVIQARTQCSGCGYCTLGCAYDRKRSAVTALLPAACGGGARVIADARVERIRVVAGRSSGCGPGAHMGPLKRVDATLLDARGQPTGRRLRVRCAAVVVAAGAIDSPCMVLRSRVGGSESPVGRSLRLHPAATVSAGFDHEVRAHRGVPHAECYDDQVGPGEAARGGFFLVPLGLTPAVSAITTPGVGPVHARRMAAWTHTATAGVMVHDETVGRVRPLPGTTRPLIQYRCSAGERADLREGLAALCRIWVEAGATTVTLPFRDLPWLDAGDDPEARVRALPDAAFNPHAILLGSVHPQGTCPISADPSAGAVTPRDLELHEQSGIFVTDASVFPTSVGVPPQLTIMALAARAATRLAARLQR